jgi:hypothetical protein
MHGHPIEQFFLLTFSVLNCEAHVQAFQVASARLDSVQSAPPDPTLTSGVKEAAASLAFGGRKGVQSDARASLNRLSPISPADHQIVFPSLFSDSLAGPAVSSSQFDERGGIRERPDLFRTPRHIGKPPELIERLSSFCSVRLSHFLGFLLFIILRSYCLTDPKHPQNNGTIPTKAITGNAPHTDKAGFRISYCENPNTQAVLPKEFWTMNLHAVPGAWNDSYKYINPTSLSSTSVAGSLAYWLWITGAVSVSVVSGADSGPGCPSRCPPPPPPSLPPLTCDGLGDGCALLPPAVSPPSPPTAMCLPRAPLQLLGVLECCRELPVCPSLFPPKLYFLDMLSSLTSTLRLCVCI